MARRISPIGIFVSFSLFFATSAMGREPTLKDLQPKKESLASAQARIDDQQMKKIYEEEQAKKRVKSEQERKIDQIPKSTTISPTFSPPGAKVTIPTK